MDIAQLSSLPHRMGLNHLYIYIDIYIEREREREIDS